MFLYLYRYVRIVASCAFALLWALCSRLPSLNAAFCRWWVLQPLLLRWEIKKLERKGWWTDKTRRFEDLKQWRLRMKRKMVLINSRYFTRLAKDCISLSRKVNFQSFEPVIDQSHYVNRERLALFSAKRQKQNRDLSMPVLSLHQASCACTFPIFSKTDFVLFYFHCLHLMVSTELRKLYWTKP